GGIEITVRDEGIGMNKEELGKLYGRYERIEREGIKRIPGTGLGLFLTQRLVELHGGHIKKKNEFGKRKKFNGFLLAKQHHTERSLGFSFQRNHRTRNETRLPRIV